MTWWRYQMETFSALLALCRGNSSVTGEFFAQRPVTRSFDVSFDLHLNKRLSKQSCYWFETPSRSLWLHRNDYVPLLLPVLDTRNHSITVAAHRVLFICIASSQVMYQRIVSPLQEKRNVSDKIRGYLAQCERALMFVCWERWQYSCNIQYGGNTRRRHKWYLTYLTFVKFLPDMFLHQILALGIRGYE